jgi:hypothetical protein
VQLIANDQPLREGAMVMRTAGSDCKEFVGMASQNYVLVADFALDHPTIP